MITSEEVRIVWHGPEGEEVDITDSLPAVTFFDSAPPTNRGDNE